MGQPSRMLSSISEPGSNRSCVTVKRTTSPIGSSSKVTLECFSSRLASSGAAQVRTSRRGRELSRTLPTRTIFRSPSARRCSHFAPGFQSDRFWVPIGGAARAVYIAFVFAVSLGLGWLFGHAGLGAAMVAHAATDLTILLAAGRVLA